MTDLRKAAEMALEALHNIDQSNNDDAIEALRQALAEPANSTTDFVEPKASSQTEQEPVAWHEPDSYGNVTTYKKWALENGWKPLYTAPPKREWVGLTDEEKGWCGAPTLQETVARVEAKLKEKNNG
jgi:hypothetical protein